MTDKLEKLKTSLTKNLPVKEKLPKVVIDKDIKDDYEFSRNTYKDLIRTGTSSLDVLAELRRLDPAWFFGVNSQAYKDYINKHTLDFMNSKDKLNGVQVEKIEYLEDGKVKIKYLEGQFKDMYGLIP